MKGFRTLVAGGALAVAPAALQYLGGIDWTLYLSPQIAPVIAAVIFAVLRLVTTGPVGRRD